MVEKLTQLDINLDTCPLLYTIQQFEKNSRTLVVEITNNGEAFDLSDFSQIQLQLDKPNGFTVLEDSTGDYLSVNDNKINILFGEHMTDVDGFMVGKLMFFNSQSMIATTLFKIRVENGLINSSEIITQSEYDSLVNLLNDILEQVENLDELYSRIDDLEDGLAAEITRAETAESNISTDVGVDNFYTKQQIDNLMNYFNAIEVVSDLDSYSDKGFYKHSTSTTLSHCPTEKCFFMIIGCSNYPYQIIFDNLGDIFYRIKLNNSWSNNWTFINPRTIDSSLSATSENPIQNKVITQNINSINSSITYIQNSFSNYYDKNTIDNLMKSFSLTKINTNSDLNSFSDLGFYYFDGNGDLSNSPTEYSFFMIIGYTNYACQIVFDYNNMVYTRQKLQNNTWNDWNCVTQPIQVDSALNTSSENPVQNKIITEKLNELFSYVSNGKRLVASAITDRGIQTSENDTFNIMANNIKNIPTDQSAMTAGYIIPIYNFSGDCGIGGYVTFEE